MQRPIDRHTALVFTMVIVAAAEGDISDRELDTIGRMVLDLPVFRGFEHGRLLEVGSACAELLKRDDGLDLAFDMIAEALPERLRETAYVLACDVAAADGRAEQEELRALELLRHRLGLERLVAAAIERAARARHATH